MEAKTKTQRRDTTIGVVLMLVAVGAALFAGNDNRPVWADAPGPDIAMMLAMAGAIGLAILGYNTPKWSGKLVALASLGLFVVSWVLYYQQPNPVTQQRHDTIWASFVASSYAGIGLCYLAGRLVRWLTKLRL